MVELDAERPVRRAEEVGLVSVLVGLAARLFLGGLPPTVGFFARDPLGCAAGLGCVLPRDRGAQRDGLLRDFFRLVVASSPSAGSALVLWVLRPTGGCERVVRRGRLASQKLVISLLRGR